MIRAYTFKAEVGEDIQTEIAKSAGISHLEHIDLLCRAIELVTARCWK